MEHGEKIRDLTEEEKLLILKYSGIFNVRKREAEAAMQCLQEAELTLQDFAIAFNKGQGPVIIAEDTLWRVK